MWIKGKLEKRNNHIYPVAIKAPYKSADYVLFMSFVYANYSIES